MSVNLSTLAITTALTGALSKRACARGRAPRSVTAQFNFVYGSGGTSLKAWLQTSLDKGLTWIDIASFAVTTSSARKVVNLSSATPVTTQATPSDGALADNTAVDGVLGDMFRLKVTSVGTYAGSTGLAVDLELHDAEGVLLTT